MISQFAVKYHAIIDEYPQHAPRELGTHYQMGRKKTRRDKERQPQRGRERERERERDGEREREREREREGKGEGPESR
jgi:hypothetical protein